MGVPTGRARERADIIFVMVDLFVVALVLLVGPLLHMRGTWVRPETARLTYAALWAALWAPNMALLLLRLRRERRASLVIGLGCQVAAVALYLSRADRIQLAALVGVGGAVLPSVLAAIRLRREALRPRLLHLAALLALPILAYLVAPHGAEAELGEAIMLCIVVATASCTHALVLWPGLHTLVDGMAESERREREWWQRHRWLNQARKGLGLAFVLAILLTLGYVAFVLWVPPR